MKLLVPNAQWAHYQMNYHHVLFCFAVSFVFRQKLCDKFVEPFPSAFIYQGWKTYFNLSSCMNSSCKPWNTLSNGSFLIYNKISNCAFSVLALLSLCFAPIATVLIIVQVVYQHCSQTTFEFFEGSICHNPEHPQATFLHLFGINFCHTKFFDFGKLVSAKYFLE
jgi:hypothetical protein